MFNDMEIKREVFVYNKRVINYNNKLKRANIASDKYEGSGLEE